MTEFRGRKKLYKIYILKNNSELNEEFLKYIQKKTNTKPIPVNNFDIVNFQVNDIIFIYELNDIAHSTFKIVNKLKNLMEKGVYVDIFKENFNTTQYKNATKSLDAILRLLTALEDSNKNSCKLGRPKSSKNKKNKLDNIQNELIHLRKQGYSFYRCAKHFKMDPKTVAGYCKKLDL